MGKNRYFIAGKIIEIAFINHEEGTGDKRSFILRKKNCRKLEETVRMLITKARNDSMVIFFPQGSEEYAPIQDFCLLLVREMLREPKGKKIKEVRLLFSDRSNFRKGCVAVEPLLADFSRRLFRNPYPAVDIIIRVCDGIILIYRKNPPSGWAIPGGFINYGESAEQAAIREAMEETGLALRKLKLFGVFSDPDRDPRFHTVSIVYTADGVGQIRPGDDALRAEIFYERNLPDDMVFDHRRILQQFFKKQRKGEL